MLNYFLDEVKNADIDEYQTNWMERNVYIVNNVRINEKEAFIGNNSYPFTKKAHVTEQDSKSGNITFPVQNRDHYACFIRRNDGHAANCMPASGTFALRECIHYIAIASE